MIIIIIQIIARVYVGNKKTYFHMDEAYSYGLMNYDKLNIADNEDFFNNWHTKEYYSDYLEINKDEKYDFSQVYENQRDDVHPPIYYLLLRIAASFTIDSFSKWTGIILNIIMIIILKFDGKSILISSFLSNVIGALYLFFKLKIYKNITRKLNDVSITRDIIKYSWPLVPNTISWWLINASDRTIVTFLISSSANGIYAISTKFSAIISSILNIFNLSWTESASLHIDDEDRDDFFSNVNDEILRLMSSVCVLLISFMPILFSIFINEKYIDAYQYIPINILASFFNCIVSIYSSIYVAKKMTKQVANTSFFAALINIIVDLVLIKFIGLYAASISTAIAYIVMAIYRSIDLRKIVKIKYDKKLIISIIVIFILSILLYYQKNIIFVILNVILTVLYSITANKKTLVFIKNKTKKFIWKNHNNYYNMH